MRTHTHTHTFPRAHKYIGRNFPWSQPSISLPTDPHSSLVVSLELSSDCGSYCPSDHNEAKGLPPEKRKRKWICWHARNLLLSVLVSFLCLPLHPPPPESVCWLLPSPQVLISTICWSRSVFWALSLSLSVLLTLPILRPVLHNSDDSIGTGCICSSVSGYIWPQLTGVVSTQCFAFEPQPLQQIRPTLQNPNKHARGITSCTCFPAQHKGRFLFLPCLFLYPPWPTSTPLSVVGQ